jgi:DNA modification methylase
VDLQTGVLYCNDNLDRLPALPAESVDLIYLDPPFFSNRVYEVIWGDEAEVRSFEDRWAGGIQNYIDWMKQRTVDLYRVLKPTGSLYFHCDPHASHYLKVMLDSIFGSTSFRNELIWRRYGAHNDTAQGSRHFGRVHDSILFYCKSAKPTWNQPFTELDPEYVKNSYRYVEPETGRRFRCKPLTAPGGAAKGNPTYEWNGHTRFWRYSRDRMQMLDKEGRLYYSRTGYVSQKHYLDESKGTPVQDLWLDVPALTGANAERLGYPTQKPIALLERIISASSNHGDVVLDPFCGCGTTVAAAEALQRQWIGIDISPTAINIMKRRLWNQSRRVPIVVDAPETVEALKQLKPFEFQNWIIDAVNGRHSPKHSGDMGIDGFWFFTNDPIQVKQSEHVGRNVIDNFETAMRRNGADTGYVMAFSFTKGAVEEVARAKADGLRIRLIKVSEVLIRMNRPGSGLEQLGPQPEGDVLPMPPMRKPSELPSAEELIESDRKAAG